MRRAATRRARAITRSPVLIGTVALFTALLVTWMRSDDEITFLGLAMLAMASMLAVAVVLSYTLQLAGFDADAADIAQRLARDPDQQRLLTRWLGRARWARFVGGFAGFVAFVLGTSSQGDLLLLGTAGIGAGAALAEMHHFRPRTGLRTARLDVRKVGDYLMTHDAHRMIGVGAAAGAVAVAGVTTMLVEGDSAAPFWWGAAALAVLGAARIAQQRVAARPRPAVSPQLTRADDLVRELAIGRGLARPATFLALALVARGGYSLIPAIGQLGRLVGAAAWTYGLYLWWHNRRLGLDFLLSESRDPVLA